MTTRSEAFLGHPSTVYYNDFFIIRCPIYFNGELPEIRGHNNLTVLYSPELVNSVPCSAIVDRIILVLKTSEDFEVRATQSFHDKNFPIVSLHFPPPKVLENIQSLLSKAQSLSHQISLDIASLFHHKNSISDVKVDVELYLCSPTRECRISRVTSGNARFYVDMYKNSALIEFPLLMEHGSVGSEQDDRGMEVKLKDVVKELIVAVDQWYGIGLQLDVPPHVLLPIQKRPVSEIERLTDMLTWVTENTRLSWSKVVQTLCTLEKKRLAQNICAKYCVPFPCKNGETSLTKEMNGVVVIGERQKLTDNETQVVRHEIECVEQNDYPILKKKIELLLKEKEDLRNKLEQERRALDILIGYRDQSRREEKQKEMVDGELCSLKDEIYGKEKLMSELQEKLNHSEKEYKSTTLRVHTLIEDLSKKSSELEKKSLSLKELEKALLQDDIESPATWRANEEKKRRDLARYSSQEDYIKEVKVQIDDEKEILNGYQEDIKKIDCSLRTKEVDIIVTSEKLERIRTSMLEKGRPFDDESPNLQFIELQIEETKRNIEMVEKRSQITIEKVQMKSLQTEIRHRKQSLKMKQNLMPCLTKSKIEGVCVPVQKTAVDCLVEFTVILYDEDGEICSGDHTLSAQVKSACQTHEVIDSKPGTKKGFYTFSYTPKFPTEFSLDIYINEQILPHLPIKLFAINSPHVPNCKISGEGVTNALKHKVVRFQVFLTDKDGYPVNSEQTVTAHLRPSSHEAECLVLPMQVTVNDIPSVYSVSYMPSVYGECKLTVLVNNEPIVESQMVVVGKTTLEPLAGAALHGELEFVKLLLQQGEVLTDVGNTALHEASRNGHTETINYLIEYGVNVNSMNKQKRTPLILAAWNGHSDAVNLLVSKGANVNLKDKRSRSALMIATWQGHKLTVEALIKHGADINDEDALGDSPLHDAARNGHDSIIIALLNNGATVDTRNYNEQTPLMIAASNGHSSAALILIKNGASLNVRDSCSRSPLLFAVENRHLSTVVTLIDHGADLNAKNYKDNTALHIASCDGKLKECSRDQSEMLTILIERGAHIDARNNLLQTPLLMASCYGCSATVHALVQKGADINVKDWLSRTAIDCAENLGHIEVYEYLQSVYQATV